MGGLKVSVCLAAKVVLETGRECRARAGERFGAASGDVHTSRAAANQEVS